ncbi:MAG TPA: helix-turn-helix domain-containing protein [Rhizomicrobium sp.]|jgi:CRP/FNR family nitrogen fixation transcriptional regulator|nr:helix-turn-helix domain-containing protein [Rhizomicrobium sp.]
MLQSATLTRPETTTIVGEPAALAKLGIVTRYGHRETIYSQGDEAKYSYQVISGAVRHSKFLLNGRRQIADFSLPGELFGFENDDEYSLTAEALSDVVAVRYPRSCVERLGDEIADVRRHLMSNLRRDLAQAQEHLVMLGRQSAKERVASFILALADRTDARNGDTIALPMGRQDIADYLGLTIETVCRAISDLKQSGVVKVPSRHQLVVLRRDVLKSLASGDGDKD